MMDQLNVDNIDFIDLSELEEHHKNEIKSLLLCTDSCVQFYWIKNKPKSLYTNTVNSNQIFAEEIHQSIPSKQGNIIQAEQSDAHYVYSKAINNCSNQTDTVAYKLPHNKNFNDCYNVPQTAASIKSHNTTTTTLNYKSVCSPTSTNIVHNYPTLGTKNVFQNGFAEQNGVQNTEKPVQPATKSWATLFSPKNTPSSHNAENGLPKSANNSAVSNTETNSKELCPIRHPKRVKSVDPGLYRMGEYLADHVVDSRTSSLQPKGLINKSNYCYINSILQALIACPPFHNLISGLTKVFNQNDKKKPSPVIDGICAFVREFSPFPENMRTKRLDKNQKKDQNILLNYDAPFEPSWIYKMLSGKSSDSFLIEGRQEDAEEFLGCILNGLNDEMLELIKLVKVEPTVEDSDAENWVVMGPKNKGSITRRTDFSETPISNIFGGLLKSRIQRSEENPTDNIQPFFTLQLNIEEVNTVREALDALVAKNKIEGVTSSKTNEEIDAWQQVTIEQLPTVLILHLKCFDYKVDGCTKIIKALEFPIVLKLDSKLLSTKVNTPKEKQYKLFAVVYHDGKEANKGHYVTDAYHVGYGTWLRYDDASVKPVQEENVLNPQGTRVPYLLFYRRSDRNK